MSGRSGGATDTELAVGEETGRARWFSLWHAVLAGLIVLLVLGGMIGHAFSPLDRRLGEARFSLTSRPPTGDIVFVEIDPASLRLVGVWPWPRKIYAELLDRLMAMGAAETVLDIDFSSSADAADDDALEAALRASGGYAALAGFRQVASDGRLVETLPLPRFRAAADIAMVNLLGEGDGVIRRYPAGMTIGGAYYPSLAELLSGQELAPGDGFDIDYGIDASSIERISAADLLAGKVDPGRVAGKQVVLGAGAQELRDFFVTPRFGSLPGGMLQILAAESLAQHRGLRQAGPLPSILFALLLALLFVIVCPRLTFRSRVGLLLAVVPLAEGGALLLQARWAILVATLPLDVTALSLALALVLEELIRRRLLHVAAARERDAVRRTLDQVIADNLDGVLVIDGERRIVAASAVAKTLVGQEGSVLGQRASAVLPQALGDAVENAFAAGSTPFNALNPSELSLGEAGSRRTIEYAVTASDIVDVRGAPRRVVCLTFRDITRRRQDEEQLAFLARHDSLTGVLSRSAFVETIDAILESDAERDRGLTVFAVDLAGFGRVNKLFGYGIGDHVLQEAAQRLERLTPLAVGRIGGDGFALARRGSLSAEAAGRVAEDVLVALTPPYLCAGHSIALSAHVGTTSSDASGFSGSQLLADADMALVSGKAFAGSSVFFSPALLERLVSRQHLEAALREGIREQRLVVHYQPQIELASGRLAGVEALVRWNDPGRGLVSPADFIGVAEETGLIVDLGRHVMTRACSDLADWPADVRLAVNVSPVQFELDDVATMVRLAATQAGMDPHRLEIELTEGVFADPGEAVMGALELLRLLGVEIALDDFGTGYSSLGQLDRLPVDTLKIDRGFVAPLPGDAGRLAIVTTMLNLARALGKRVVAEGVESAAQADLLRRLGCALGQGYYFDKPMPIETLRQRYLRRPHLMLVATSG